MFQVHQPQASRISIDSLLHQTAIVNLKLRLRLQLALASGFDPDLPLAPARSSEDLETGQDRKKRAFHAQPHLECTAELWLIARSIFRARIFIRAERIECKNNLTILHAR